MLCYATFTIEAAHKVPAPLGVPEWHGHSYTIRLYAETTAAAPVSVELMQEHAKKLHGLLDHKCLNDILGDMPTMESMIDYMRENWDGPALARIDMSIETQQVGVTWAA